MRSMQEDPTKRKCPARKWTKWAGIATFMFFLIKGLAWLIVPAVIYYFASSQ